MVCCFTMLSILCLRHHLLDSLGQLVSTFLMLQPFNTLPHVVVTPSHQLFSLLLHTPVKGPFDPRLRTTGLGSYFSLLYFKDSMKYILLSDGVSAQVGGRFTPWVNNDGDTCSEFNLCPGRSAALIPWLFLLQEPTHYHCGARSPRTLLLHLFMGMSVENCQA